MTEKIKILIVEDERALADLLEVKLKKEGYDVEVSYDGEDGYNKITEWQPSLILLDIVMPKMDGYEVLEKMKENNISIPVIIISNSGQPVELEKTKKLGAVDSLVKAEFDPAEVLIKIRNYLNQGDAPMGEEEVKPVASNIDAKPLGVKVLLVEDESFLREICSRKLANEGFTVYTAVDGEQAVKYVDKVKPDIVLLDIILPAIDGFEVLRLVRANSDEKLKNIPVIMLSNLGQEDDIQKAMALGASSYLIKAHFTTDEIVNKIKEILKIAK